MATATRKSAAKAKVAAAKGKTTAAKKGVAAKATSKKTADGPSKRETQKARDAELTVTILEKRDAGEKWGEIASDLSITPGKAQFLFMLHSVAEGDVKRIAHKDDDSLVAGIKRAREANDAYSSWGWIAARTGVSEGKVKALAEEAGMSVKGSNVAVARSEANGGGKKADTKTGTQAGRKTGTSTAKSGKAAAAKAKAKTRRAAAKKTDPS